MEHCRRTLLVIAVALLAGCPPATLIHVVDTSPEDGATGVPANGMISITFDRAASPATLDAGIEPDVAVNTNWSTDAQTVTLMPTTPLAAGAMYTVTVYDVEPAGGGSLDEEYSFSFTTAAESVDYRQAMRDFVIDIADYARTAQPTFIVVPQNGEALLTDDGTGAGTPVAAYIAAIDGQGREDLFYGYENDDEPTPADARDELLDVLTLAEDEGVEVLVTDYCSTPAYVDDSYTQNEMRGFASFAAHRRDLDAIPAYPAQPHNVNAANVGSLSDAENFLYVLDPSAFVTRTAYLEALAATDYDLLILDLFYDDTVLTPTEVNALRTKDGGGSRLLIAYMSIGEAEDYRYYWQPSWQPGTPDWLQTENPVWEGNYKVEYWHPEWQAVIFGDSGAYLDRILAAGFDGVYLDIIDAYEYFEETQAR